MKQTVVLNTPGVQDGAFALDVDGRRVIDRHDVFYRDVPSAVQRRDVDSDVGAAVDDGPLAVCYISRLSSKFNCFRVVT